MAMWNDIIIQDVGGVAARNLFLLAMNLFCGGGSNFFSTYAPLFTLCSRMHHIQSKHQ
jgi:hypothetical protein